MSIAWNGPIERLLGYRGAYGPVVLHAAEILPHWIQRDMM
jgi:hypothetical protein